MERNRVLKYTQGNVSRKRQIGTALLNITKCDIGMFQGERCVILTLIGIIENARIVFFKIFVFSFEYDFTGSRSREKEKKKNSESPD